jgi:hypothetical protein
MWEEVEIEVIYFQLYNEPEGISWSQWLKGDSTYAGMQELYDAVRSTNATSIFILFSSLLLSLSLLPPFFFDVVWML